MSANGRDRKGRFTKGNRIAVGPPGNKHAENRARHGLDAMKRRLYELGNRALDRRFSLGRSIMQWRDNLIADLGGETELSTQQRAVIDVCVKTKLLLDSVDVWLLEQPTIVNNKKRCLIPVIEQRTNLAGSLVRHLKELGLGRRARTVDNDLETYLESIRAEDAANASANEDGRGKGKVKARTCRR